MSETETSTAACVDGRPDSGSGKAAGHPVDTVLRRIFEDPGMPLKSEPHLARTLADGCPAIAGGQPAPAVATADGEADEDDDIVVEGDLDADDVGADGAEAREARAPNAAASSAVRGRQADRLIALAQAGALFRTPEGEVFADLAIDGHRETWAIRGKGFRHWLTRQFFATHRSAPSIGAIQDAVGVLEATALAGSGGAPERRVHLRVGGAAGKLCLDLGDAAWRAVEIDEAGWRVVATPAVRFRRTARQRALPVPETGGSVEALRGLCNLRSEEDLVMVVAWALAALRERGPCPILVLTGEQGSAKSTCTAMLQALIDPTAAPPRGLPREGDELIGAGRSAHLLAFDNISAVPSLNADALCRMVGGSGSARPVILNGLVDLVGRSDLADRTVTVTLPAIPACERRPEAELWLAFEAERPRLLGALLGAVAEGLRRAGRIRSAALPLPRLADFVLWGTACETALWPAGTVRAAYDGNRRGAVFDTLEADPLIDALLDLMWRQKEQAWEGTASELRVALARSADGSPPDRNLPGNPRLLAVRLRQLAAYLRPFGIDVSFGRHAATRARLIRLWMDDEVAQAAGERAERPAAWLARTQNPVPNAGDADEDDCAFV